MRKVILKESDYHHVFDERLDIYFRDGIFPQFDHLGDFEILDLALDSEVEVTLEQRNGSGVLRYRIVNHMGVEFGVGYRTFGDKLEIRTIIAPYDVVTVNRERKGLQEVAVQSWREEGVEWAV